MEAEPRRERMEAMLTDAEMATIREWCSALLIPLRTWPDQPDLRVFADLAVHRTAQLARRSGVVQRQTKAIENAALWFGLKPGAVLKRWQRRRKAILATDCPPVDKV